MWALSPGWREGGAWQHFFCQAGMGESGLGQGASRVLGHRGHSGLTKGSAVDLSQSRPRAVEGCCPENAGALACLAGIPVLAHLPLRPVQLCAV